MCVGCKEMKPKGELIRVVRSPDKEISIDMKGKKPGRGAYICKDSACLENALNNRMLERAFRQRVEDDIREELIGQMKGSEEDPL